MSDAIRMLALFLLMPLFIAAAADATPAGSMTEDSVDSLYVTPLGNLIQKHQKPSISHAQAVAAKYFSAEQLVKFAANLTSSPLEIFRDCGNIIKQSMDHYPSPNSQELLPLSTTISASQRVSIYDIDPNLPTVPSGANILLTTDELHIMAAFLKTNDTKNSSCTCQRIFEWLNRSNSIGFQNPDEQGIPHHHPTDPVVEPEDLPQNDAQSSTLGDFVTLGQESPSTIESASDPSIESSAQPPHQSSSTSTRSEILTAEVEGQSISISQSSSVEAEETIDKIIDDFWDLILSEANHLTASFNVTQPIFIDGKSLSEEEAEEIIDDFCESIGSASNHLTASFNVTQPIFIDGQSLSEGEAEEIIDDFCESIGSAANHLTASFNVTQPIFIDGKSLSEEEVEEIIDDFWESIGSAANHLTESRTPVQPLSASNDHERYSVASMQEGL